MSLAIHRAAFANPSAQQVMGLDLSRTTSAHCRTDSAKHTTEEVGKRMEVAAVQWSFDGDVEGVTEGDDVVRGVRGVVRGVVGRKIAES